MSNVGLWRFLATQLNSCLKVATLATTGQKGEQLRIAKKELGQIAMYIYIYIYMGPYCCLVNSVNSIATMSTHPPRQRVNFKQHVSMRGSIHGTIYPAIPGSKHGAEIDIRRPLGATRLRGGLSKSSVTSLVSLYCLWSQSYCIVFSLQVCSL